MYLFNLKVLCDKVNLSTVRCCYLAELEFFSVRTLKGRVKFLRPETVVASFLRSTASVRWMLVVYLEKRLSVVLFV